MKKMILGLVTIVFIVLIAVAAKEVILKSKNENITITNKVIDEEKILDGSNINNIDISCYNLNVNLIPSDDNKIRVHISGKIPQKNTDRAYSMLVNSSQGKASIEVKWDKTITVALMKSQQLDIYIPKVYSSDIFIDASNGDVTAEGFNFQNFNVNATSGNIAAKSLKAENSKIKSSSGYIKLNEFAGNIIAKSSSGAINVQYASFASNVISLESASGDLKLSIPKDAAFYLKARSSSGKVSCGFPIQVKESGKNKLEGASGEGQNEVILDTHSGDIDIQ